MKVWRCGLLPRYIGSVRVGVGGMGAEAWDMTGEVDRTVDCSVPKTRTLK